MTYPDESIQNLADPPPWWEKDDGKTFCRGRLCRAFVPFIPQTPITLEPIGRSEPTKHDEFDAKLQQIRIGQARKLKALPVAAFPLMGSRDMYTVYQAKVRPCIILGDGCVDLPPEICKNRPSWQKAHTVVVAPYFGVEADGTRAGFPAPFLDRVKHCEFPQFFWDILPHNNKESMLFFMQSQPMGKHHDSLERTEYKLSARALAVIDEWLLWSFTGKMSTKGFLFEARETLLSLATS